MAEEIVSEPKHTDELGKNWVQDSEKARGRQWRGVGPLTLDILATALGRQHPHLPALTVDNARQLCALPQSLSLILSSLGSTELLWLFPRLVTLDLANNFLTHIQGVGECLNLQRLNLSHNQLSRVTGLSQLRQLEVLSAQHNRIDQICPDDLLGLDKLQVVNIGANLLASSEDIIALRVLPSLRSLSADDNPVTSQQPQLVLALLPQLVFINGSRVKENQLREAAANHRSVVAEVEAQELDKRMVAEEAEARRKAAAQHQQAGVAGLDDGSLFSLMTAGDVDMKVFLRLPGADKLLAKYEERLNCACVQVFKAGMQHDLQRCEELETAGSCLQEAYKEADDKARSQVLSLAEDVRGAARRLEVAGSAAEKFNRPEEDEATAQAGTEDVVAETEAEAAEVVKEKTEAETVKEAAQSLLEAVGYDMLEREVVLADQVTDVIEKADAELRQMVDGFLSSAGTQFVEARHHAYSFYCQLRQLSARFANSPSLMTLFKSSFSDSAEQEEESLLEAAQRVFQGEDTLALSQAAIHDRHLDAISSREQKLQQHLHSWLTSTVQAMHRQEWRRHRLRIQEINAIIEEHRRTIQAAGEQIFTTIESSNSSSMS